MIVLSLAHKKMAIALLSVFITGLLSSTLLGQSCFCRKPKACCQCCPEDSAVAPSPDTDIAPDPLPLDGQGDLPSTRFAALASNSVVVPNMIGDFFGGNTSYSIFNSGTSPPIAQGSLAISGGDRRFKFAENTSPFPTNRVFFNYHHFQGPVSDANGVTSNIDRFVFGLEKTFWCDLASVEMRIPLVGGLNAQQTLAGNAPVSNRATEFGNIVFSVKGLLWQDDCSALAAGMSMTLPTAEETTVRTNDGTLAITIENNSVHLQPFLGYYRKISDRVFLQSYVQLDFDANGNDVLIGATKDFAGTYQDQNLLMMDLTLGYWLCRNRCAPIVKGIAPVIELHYNTMISDTDTVDGRGVGGSLVNGLVTNPYNRMDVLNLTGGVHFELGCASNLTLGVVVPLRENEEQLFDSEFVLQFSRRF